MKGGYTMSDEKAQTLIYLPVDTKKAMQRQALDEGRSLSSIYEELSKQYLKRKKKGGKK